MKRLRKTKDPEDQGACSPMERWNYSHRNDGKPGKGSSPRSCFSESFRVNYDRIFNTYEKKSQTETDAVTIGN